MSPHTEIANWGADADEAAEVCSLKPPRIDRSRLEPSRLERLTRSAGYWPFRILALLFAVPIVGLGLIVSAAFFVPLLVIEGDPSGLPIVLPSLGGASGLAGLLIGWRLHRNSPDRTHTVAVVLLLIGIVTAAAVAVWVLTLWATALTHGALNAGESAFLASLGALPIVLIVNGLGSLSRSIRLQAEFHDESRNPLPVVFLGFTVALGGIAIAAMGALP